MAEPHMDEVSEQAILDNAAMTVEAIAVSRALLDSDLSEARFRAQLLHHQAAISGDASLEEAASRVVRLLGPPGSIPSLGCGAAVLAVSTHLAERLA